MVDAHGGTIDVKSRPGEGTAFKISFLKAFQPQDGK
jgi:signal transduction histidine kinase